MQSEQEPAIITAALEREGTKEADARAEMHTLAASLRMHLLWLREGGVTDLPAAPSRPARPPSAPPGGPPRVATPAPRQVTQAQVIDHQAPRRPDELPRRCDAPPDPRGNDLRPPWPTGADEPPPWTDEDAGQAGRMARPEPARPMARADATVRQARPQSHAQLPDPLPSLHEDGLQVVRDVLGNCQRCKLCHGRTELVFGQGHPAPLVAFVGEGPGAEEDRTGQPFVGAAGDLLTQMIAAMGNEARKRGFAEIAQRLRRDQVYICNVVKCRPPGNRTPEPDEIAACSPFLRGQLHALRPRVIVSLGRTPTHHLLGTTAPISRLRGTWQSWEGVPVMPTFHPAYLLRTPSAKRQVWEDLQAVIVRLQEICEAEHNARPDTP